MEQIQTNQVATPQAPISSEKTNRGWDIAVVWPLIHFVLFFAFIAYTAMQSFSNPNQGAVPFSLGIAFLILMLSHLVTMVLLVVLFVYSIHRLYTRTSLPDSHKKTWFILLLIFNVFAFPILHFKHLRK